MYYRQRESRNRNQKSLSPLQKAESLTAFIQEKIEGELENQEMSISRRPKPFFTQQEQVDYSASKLKKIKQDKLSIEKRLKDLKQLQKQYQMDIRPHQSSTSPRARSYFSKQDQARLQQLQARRKKYEGEIEQKARLIEQKRKEIQKQEQEEKQQKRLKKNVSKKIAISRNLQDLSQRRQKRIKKFEEERKVINKLKLQKTLQQRKHEEWSEKEELQRRKNQKLMEEKLKQIKFDFLTLKEHEAQYEVILKKNKEEAQKKRRQWKKNNLTALTPGLNQSKLNNQLIKEEERKKIESTQRKNMELQKYKRRWEYGNIVEQYYTPRNRVKTESQIAIPKKQINIKTGLNQEEVKNLGYMYLNFNKTRADKNSKGKSQNELVQPAEGSSVARTNIDYLSEFRKGKKKRSGKSLRAHCDFSQQVEEARKVVNKTAFSEAQKVQKVKMLAARIENKSHNSKSWTLISKISAKIEMLQALNS